MKIEGTVAVVIGGARGIGKEYCRALLENGAKVVCGDVLDDLGERLESDFASEFKDSFVYAQCDVTHGTQVAELFERARNRFKEVEIVVNAAVCISQKDWKKTIDVNVTGCVRLIQEALKHMGKNKKGRGGAIILTSSLFAFYPFLACPTYGGTCGMTISLVKSWAHPVHFETTGVRFNAICPGIAKTKMWNALNDKENVLHVEKAKEELDKFDRISLDQCTDALITLLSDDIHNGDIMVCSATRGNFIDNTYQEYIGLQ